MLHDHWEPQRRRCAVGVLDPSSHHVSRELDAGSPRCHLHTLARGFEEQGSGPRIRHVELLQCLHDLNAGAVFGPGSVTEIEDNVETLLRDFDNLPNGSTLMK